MRHDPRQAAIALGGVDRYYDFRNRAKHFIALYAALVPDPAVIRFEPEVKLAAAMIPMGKQEWEQEEADLSFGDYSAKIREMLEDYVEVTGIKSICTLRSLSDPLFWADFGATEPKDLATAAVRKTAELKKVLSERMADNPERYARFSERLKELIASFQPGLFDDAEAGERLERLERLEELARDIDAEDSAHEHSRLNEGAYGIWTILKENVADDELSDGPTAFDEATTAVVQDLTLLEQLAESIAEVYTSDAYAPMRWQEKPPVRQQLRSQVRHLLLKRNVPNWQELPEKIEKFAILHYGKS